MSFNTILLFSFLIVLCPLFSQADDFDDADYQASLPKSKQQKEQVYVDLSFAPMAKISSYTFEIYADDSLKEKVLTEEISEPRLRFYPKGPGVYYYRVAVTDFWDRTSPFSALKKFNIVPGVELLKAPELLTPMKILHKGVESLKYGWKGVNYNDGYELEIALDDQFQNVIYKKTVDDDIRSLEVKKQDLTKLSKITTGRELYFARVSALYKLQSELVKKESKSLRVDYLKIPQEHQLKEGEFLPSLEQLIGKPSFLSVNFHPSTLEYSLTNLEASSTLLSSTLNYKNFHPLAFSIDLGQEIYDFFSLSGFSYAVGLDYHQGGLQGASYNEAGGRAELAKMLYKSDFVTLMTGLGIGLHKHTFSTISGNNAYKTLSSYDFSFPILLETTFFKFQNFVNILRAEYSPILYTGYQLAYKFHWQATDVHYWTLGFKMAEHEVDKKSYVAKVTENAITLEFGKMLDAMTISSANPGTLMSNTKLGAKKAIGMSVQINSTSEKAGSSATSSSTGLQPQISFDMLSRTRQNERIRVSGDLSKTLSSTYAFPLSYDLRVDYSFIKNKWGRGVGVESLQHSFLSGSGVGVKSVSKASFNLPYLALSKEWHSINHQVGIGYSPLWKASNPLGSHTGSGGRLFYEGSYDFKEYRLFLNLNYLSVSGESYSLSELGTSCGLQIRL